MQTTKNRVFVYIDLRDDYCWFPPEQCPRCGAWSRDTTKWKELNGAKCCDTCCSATCRCGEQTEDIEGDQWGEDFKGRGVCPECQGKPRETPEPSLWSRLWAGLVVMWNER